MGTGVAGDTQDGNTSASTAELPTRRGRGRGAHPTIAFLVAFFIVLGALEGGVRLAASRLPEPRDYFANEAQVVADDMKVLQRAGVHSRLTFVGTSMVRRGIAANRMEKELGWGPTTVHNVALPGAQTRIVEQWLLKEVIPRLHSQSVVWGVSSLDFNANRPNPPIDLYDKARATQKGFYGGLDRMMGKLALSENRDVLRHPIALQSSLTGGKPTSFNHPRPLADRATWRLGQPEFTPAGLAHLRSQHAKTVRGKQLHDYEIGAKEWSAFVDTLSALKRRHIRVAVVVMPVTTGYLSFHPQGPSQYDEWKARVVAETHRQGVPIIDLSRSMPDSAFVDYEHLWSDAGTNTFTPMLAQRLKALGW